MTEEKDILNWGAIRGLISLSLEDTGYSIYIMCPVNTCN